MAISNLKLSRIIYGAMGIGGEWNSSPLEKKDISEGQEAIEAAIEIGINFFDHANIYRVGKSEEVFGYFLENNSALREKLYIQSKVGIDNGKYNFAYDHIISEVKGSLKRLKTDYMDCLLLHRPDPLMDVKELKAALDYLFNNGMIRAIGVSNMSHHQIEHIQYYIERPIAANQLQMSLAHIDWVSAGVEFNRPDYANTGFPIGTVEYCTRNNISIQAYGALANGFFSGRQLAEDAPQNRINTNNMVAKMALEKEVSREAIVLAWLMRHPANICPVIGTKNPDRIRAVKAAFDLELSREEWYDLFRTSRGVPMP